MLPIFQIELRAVGWGLWRPLVVWFQTRSGSKLPKTFLCKNLMHSFRVDLISGLP